MKSILSLLVIFAMAFAGEMNKFYGVQNKSATLSKSVPLFTAVDTVTSAPTGYVGSAPAGKAEILAVYSPYIGNENGFSWVELLKQNADGSYSVDENSIKTVGVDASQGVAYIATPPDLNTVVTGKAVLPGAKVSFTKVWPQWAKFKLANGTVGFGYVGANSGVTLE